MFLYVVVGKEPGCSQCRWGGRRGGGRGGGGGGGAAVVIIPSCNFRISIFIMPVTTVSEELRMGNGSSIQSVQCVQDVSKFGIQFAKTLLRGFLNRIL